MKNNIWYVIGQKDDTSPYGYTQITPKGQYFKSLDSAKKEAKKRQQLEYKQKKEIVVFERTCKVIKE